MKSTGYSRVNTDSGGDIKMFCQDTAHSLDNGGNVDTIIIDFSMAFNLVLQDPLLIKIAALRVNLRVVAWIREILLGRVLRVWVERQLSEEI
jgi:hypothetical protein